MEILGKIGSIMCHQIPERTIPIGGNLLPLCSRCTGIYTGFFLGVLYQFTLWQTKIKELPNLKILLFSISLLGLLIIDSLGSHFKLWSLTNHSLLALGLLGGSSISLFLLPVFNYSFFQDSKRDTGIKHLIEYIGLLFFMGLVFLIHFVDSSIIYRFIASASIFGLVLLYLFINTTIGARIINWKNWKKRKLSGAFLLLGLVLVLTLIEFYILIWKKNIKL